MDDAKAKDAARHDEVEEDCDIESGSQQLEDAEVSKVVVDDDQSSKSRSTEGTTGATESMHDQNTPPTSEKQQVLRSETTVTQPGAVAASSHGSALITRKAVTQPYSAFEGDVETEEEENDIILDATAHPAPAHNHSKEDIDEEETEICVVMLEATPVQEIYAT
jgi:hypothetical protein